MRERLDAVHKKLGLPILDAELYDQKHNEKDAIQAGMELRAALAKERTLSDIATQSSGDDPERPKTVVVDLTHSEHRNHTHLYKAILKSPPMTRSTGCTSLSLMRSTTKPSYAGKSMPRRIMNFPRISTEDMELRNSRNGC
jgi:hypothetical protein